MKDHEKSVKLARLSHWKYLHDGITGEWWYKDEKLYDEWQYNKQTREAAVTSLNLYDPANMALAWRVCGWVYKHTLYEGGPPIGEAFHDWWFDDYEAPDPGDPEAQRLWLDKILELATEAGMVE